MWHLNLFKFWAKNIAFAVSRKMRQIYLVFIYSRLSRCSKVRGSSTGFSLVGPARFKACKSFYSLKVLLYFKIKQNRASNNTNEHWLNISMKQNSKLLEYQQGNDKGLKRFLTKYEKYGTLSIYATHCSILQFNYNCELIESLKKH